MQKQMEKQEFFKMRKAVQAMRSTGELERYNSLKAKEKNEDERIEQQVLDLNMKQERQVKVTRTITSMIDKKKVVMDNVGIKTTIINHKNIEIETTIHKNVSQTEGNKVRGSYVGGSSMLSIMKNSVQGPSGMVPG